MASGALESSSIALTSTYNTSSIPPDDSPTHSYRPSTITHDHSRPTSSGSDASTPPHNHITPHQDPPPIQPYADENDVSDPSSEEDAEGEEDDDYEETAPPAKAVTPASASSSNRSQSDASSSSGRSAKRKRDDDEADFMAADPVLYGMRRSGRSRQQRNVIRSDSDSSDDGSSRRRRAKKSRSKPAHRPARPPPPPPTRRFDDSASDSEGYIQNKKKVDTRRDKERKRLIAQGQLEATIGNVRVNTRNDRRPHLNYAEEGLDDEAEFMTENSGNEDTIVVDTGPKIGEVLNYQLLEDSEWDPHMGPEEFQYLILWQGKSHLHATWKTYQELKNTGLRLDKVRNYFHREVSKEVYIQTAPDVDEQEREEFCMKREEILDNLADHKLVKRVIGEREEESGTGSEYYILWKGLNYDRATWETSDIVADLNIQDEIDAFYERDQELPSSGAKPMAKQRPLTEQPDYIKFGKLREFQLTGLNFLGHSWLNNKNVILADEMGLGKTVQTVSWLSWLKNAHKQQGPFLVVVPLSTMPAWADTFRNWAPDMNYVEYYGPANARDVIREYELLVDNNPRRPKFHVLLTTFELVLKDEKFLTSLRWQALVVDEAHRLKNRDAKLYISLQNLNIPSRLLLTGTPLQNNLAELSALMDFINPGAVEIDANLDLNAPGAADEINKVNRTIAMYMLRRTKKMVMTDLPPCTEKILRVPLSNYQTDLYKLVVEKNYTELNKKGEGAKTSLLNVMMELKKCCNHPFLVGNSRTDLVKEDAAKEEYLRALITNSGKMMLLEQLLAKLKREGHRVLIFTQMVQQLNILAEYLRQRGYKHQRLDGTTNRAARERAMVHFQDKDSDDFVFILSTRAGGLGLNLMAADTVIIFDSDWNPQADIQAVSRAHRMGQTRPVTAYRFVSKDTVEEQIQERARNKRILEYLTIQRGWVDEDKKKADEQMRAKGIALNEPTSQDDVSRLLKQGSAKMFAQSSSDNQKSLEELDIDAMVDNADLVENNAEEPNLLADGGDDFLKSFQYTDVQVELEWDEIIPKEQLALLKEEERRRQEALDTAELLEQSRPRNRKKPQNDDGVVSNGRNQRAAKRRAKVVSRNSSDLSELDESESEAELDPKREFTLNDTRRLIEAYKKYGYYEECKDKILKDARLIGRDEDMLKKVISDVCMEAQSQLESHGGDAVDLAATPAQKKERKEILFNFRGTKNQNATVIIERPKEMKMVRDFVATFDTPYDTRITSASKGPDYTCEWTSREDGMLIVGIARHGFGAWADIRDDPELAMSDKLFLEEKRVGVQKELKEKKEKGEKIQERKPQATHLVRRINYLLDALKAQLSASSDPALQKTLDNHHRNRRRKLQQEPGDASAVSSPAARDATPAGRKSNSKRSRGRGDSRAEKARGDHLDEGRPSKKPRPTEKVPKNMYATLIVAKTTHHQDSVDRDRRGSSELKRKSLTPDPDAEDGEIREHKRPRSSEGPNGNHRSPMRAVSRSHNRSPAVNGLGDHKDRNGHAAHASSHHHSPYDRRDRPRSRSPDRRFKNEEGRRDRSHSRMRAGTEDRPVSRHQGVDRSKPSKSQQNGHRFEPYSREGRRSKSPSKKVKREQGLSATPISHGEKRDQSKSGTLIKKEEEPKPIESKPIGLPPRPPPQVDTEVLAILSPRLAGWKEQHTTFTTGKLDKHKKVALMKTMLRDLHETIFKCVAAVPSNPDVKSQACERVAYHLEWAKVNGDKLLAICEKHAPLQASQTPSVLPSGTTVV